MTNKNVEVTDDFVPVVVAADLSGYTPAWVRRLALRNVIRARESYGRPLVSVSDLCAYKARTASLGAGKFALRYKEAESATA